MEIRLPRTITSTSGNCCSMVSSNRSCGPSRRTMATSSTTTSTRLLAKGAFLQGAAQDVSVHVENRLTDGFSGVEDQPELPAAVFVREGLGGGDQVGEQSGVSGGQFGDVAVVGLLRNHQQVHGSLRGDVAD